MYKDINHTISCQMCYFAGNQMQYKSYAILFYYMVLARD